MRKGTRSVDINTQKTGQLVIVKTKVLILKRNPLNPRLFLLCFPSIIWHVLGTIHALRLFGFHAGRFNGFQHTANIYELSHGSKNHVDGTLYDSAIMQLWLAYGPGWQLIVCSCFTRVFLYSSLELKQLNN